MKKSLVIIAGPTAVGKTDISIKLAKKIGGEIISADSIQVYKGLDIGSAKIKPEEMQGIKHYLIDELEPEDEFNIYKFKEMASKYIDEIIEKGKIPIIVGGTGFYIQSVLYDTQFEESEDTEQSHYRQELESLLLEKGNDHLHDILKEIDPESAEIIHKNNSKRVIRAIEFYKLTGEKISKHNKEQRENTSPYNFAYFVLNRDRDLLYERINKRVEIMKNEGLENEVRALYNRGIAKSNTSMQGIGYKEMFEHIENPDTFTVDEAYELIKLNSRHFAKRQLTWFRREKEVSWLNYEDYDNSEDLMLLAMTNILKEKEII